MTDREATHVYKILPRKEWVQAQDIGRFDGSAVDLRDGYIHLSTASQAGETAWRHFAGVEGLVLLKLRAADFGAALRWEPSRDDQLFPHLYATLDPTAVVSARPLETGPGGWPDPGVLEP